MGYRVGLESDTLYQIDIINNLKTVKYTRKYPDIVDIIVRCYASIAILKIVFELLSVEYNQ